MTGGKKYVKGRKKLKADGIEICDTAGHTIEENRIAEWMYRTIKNTVRVMLLHSSAPWNLRADYLYAVFDELSHVVRVGHLKTPEELSNGVKPIVAHVKTSFFVILLYFSMSTLFLLHFRLMRHV